MLTGLIMSGDTTRRQIFWPWAVTPFCRAGLPYVSATGETWRRGLKCGPSTGIGRTAAS